MALASGATDCEDITAVGNVEMWGKIWETCLHVGSNESDDVDIDLTSLICTVRIGPSMLMTTERNPEPGRNFCFSIACSSGTNDSVMICVSDTILPRTASLFA